jgi:nitrile hydratase accessory protein
VADLDGEAALPRKNGELVFTAPWEGRAFGMAVALHERGAYEWEHFRHRLISQVADGSSPYYESWLAALESLVVQVGLVSGEELSERAAEFKELRRDAVLDA